MERRFFLAEVDEGFYLLDKGITEREVLHRLLII